MAEILAAIKCKSRKAEKRRRQKWCSRPSARAATDPAAICARIEKETGRRQESQRAGQPACERTLFASHLCTKAPICEIVQKLAGHTNYMNKQIYTHVGEERCPEEHAYGDLPSAAEK